MVPRRFLVTFGHMNTLQKELNCFVVGKSWTWPPLILTAPFITQKKNCSVYKVYGTQNDQLELTISTQKLVLKNMQRVPDFGTCSVGYILVYSLFSVGDVFMEKSAIQNCHFSDFSKHIKKDQF